jgi:hypothetical protein
MRLTGFMRVEAGIEKSDGYIPAAEALIRI